MISIVALILILLCGWIFWQRQYIRYIRELEAERIELIARVKYLEDWLEEEFCFSCDEDDLKLENTTRL